MENYRKSSHTVYDIKYHIVWIMKYRKQILRADIAHLGTRIDPRNMQGV
jgi:putative transposase